MNNSLFHWGIPGMRWGIRRKKSGGSSRPESEDHKTVSGLRKKKVSEMSNDELKKLTTRLQLEKQLKDLSVNDISPGKKFVSDLLGDTTKKVAKKYLADISIATIEALAKKSGLTASLVELTRQLNSKRS